MKLKRFLQSPAAFPRYLWLVVVAGIGLIVWANGYAGVAGVTVACVTCLVIGLFQFVGWKLS